MAMKTLLSRDHNIGLARRIGLQARKKNTGRVRIMYL